MSIIFNHSLLSSATRTFKTSSTNNEIHGKNVNQPRAKVCWSEIGLNIFLITRAPKKIIPASNNCSFLHRLHLQANKQRISKTLKAPPRKTKYIFHETVNKHKYLQNFFCSFWGGHNTRIFIALHFNFRSGACDKRADAMKRSENCGWWKFY